jgi:Putative peptidoglycan binding domain
MNETDDSGTGPAGSGEHVVQPGETLVGIAEETGHFWQTLWDHPANAELKRVRREPNVLLPGDRLTIPPLETKTVRCATGRVHTFRRKGVPVKVTFQVLAPEGRAFAGKSYTLEVGRHSYSGTTDDNGRVEHFVMPAAKQGTLRVTLEEEGYPDVVEWTLEIGALQPVESVAGVRNRLNALGYEAGLTEGALDEQARAALRGFQEEQGLEVTGEADATTLEKLKQVYGY